MRQVRADQHATSSQGQRPPVNAVYIHVFIVLLCLLSAQVALAQRCYISPSLPIGVLAGGTYNFSADCGTGVTWTVFGDGWIDGNGVYHAPSSVRVHNQDRGCQVSPNNSPFNVPVDDLPVDSHSNIWLQRAAQDHPELPQYHSTKFFPQTGGFYSNVVDSNATQELMHFYYPTLGYQDTNFAIPDPKTWVMENGVNMDPSSGHDRHVFTMNKDSCEMSEVYNLYVDFRTVTFTPGNPTGVTWTTNTTWQIPQGYLVYVSGATGQWSQANNSWRLTLTGPNSGTLPFDSSQWGPAPSGTVVSSLSNNCTNCNAQSGQKFRPDSYSQFGGVDAAGMPIGALSLKLEEWYAATRAGRSDIGHALRTTIGNNYLSSRYVWPATSYALGVAGYTRQLDSASNTNPVTFYTSSDLSRFLPCDNYTYGAGCTFHVHIFNINTNSPWSDANGDWAATAVDNNHFTIQLDGTGFGSFPGGLFQFDFFPYGATVRLKSSVDVDSLCSSTSLDDPCPYAKVYLNTIKKYGLIVSDGTTPADNWDNSTIASEFHPDVLVDASQLIRNWGGLQPIEPNLEVVDRSSQKLFTDLGRYQDSSTNRTYVEVCGSYGCADTDVLLQGTTIGTDKERLLVASGVSYQLNVWAHGNVDTSLTYSIDSGIPGATVSNTGVLTMPACTAKQRGMVTVTSTVDSDALPLYISVTCLPVSADGGYRMALGNYSGDYTDSSNNIWWGGWGTGGWGTWDETPGLGWAMQTGTWEGFANCENDTWTGADSQLFSRSTSYRGDTQVELVLPNGSYNVRLYGEPGFNGWGDNHTCPSVPGVNVFDWSVQGRTVNSWVDGYIQSGQNYVGYNLDAPATVTDNVLNTSGRIRVISTYGMSWSSLLISPSIQPQLTITTTSLPHGYARIPYVGHLNATNGFPPYTWSLASGSGPLPPGLLISNTGLIFGRPSVGGSYPVTVQVTDTQNNTATKDITVVVCTPGHLC